MAWRNVRQGRADPVRSAASLVVPQSRGKRKQWHTGDLNRESVQRSSGVTDMRGKIIRIRLLFDLKLVDLLLACDECAKKWF